MKYRPIKLILSFLIFAVFFIVPHFVQYFQQGIIINGDNNILENQFINTSAEIIIHIKVSFIKSLNLLKNPIFIFFIVSFLVQKIIKKI